MISLGKFRSKLSFILAWRKFTYNEAKRAFLTQIVFQDHRIRTGISELKIKCTDTKSFHPKGKLLETKSGTVRQYKMIYPSVVKKTYLLYNDVWNVENSLFKCLED